MKNPKRLRNMIIFIVIFIGALFLLYPRNIIIYGVSEGTYATTDTEENLKDGMIIAATDDGKYIYEFKVLDNDTLTFVQHGSICPKNLSKHSNSGGFHASE